MLTRIDTPSVRTAAPPGLAAVLEHPRYEVLPLSGIEETVTQYLPEDATVTVTASPRQGMSATANVATRLARRGWHVVPHLSARLIADEAELKSLVSDLTAAGVREVFVIGGDPDTPAGDFAGSLELLQTMHQIGHDFEVGIAGYPESHPKISADVAVQAMWDKRVYADYIVSQMCFESRPVLEWVRRVRQRGVLLPIYVGLAGPVNTAKLIKTSTRIGVGQSLRVLGHHGPKMLRMLRPGTWSPDKMLSDIAPAFADPSYGLDGIHINTFNAIRAAEQWRQRAVQRLT